MQSSEGWIFIRFHLAATSSSIRAVGRRLLPDEAGAVAHDGQRRGGVGPLVAGQDRRLAAAERRSSGPARSAVATSVLPLSRNASRVTSRTSPSA